MQITFKIIFEIAMQMCQNMQFEAFYRSSVHPEETVPSRQESLLDVKPFLSLVRMNNTQQSTDALTRVINPW